MSSEKTLPEPPSETELPNDSCEKGSTAQYDIGREVEIINKMKRIVTSPVHSDKGNKNLAALSRQLKLYINVNEDMREALANSSTMEQLVSMPRRCSYWPTVLYDLMMCVSILIPLISPEESGVMLCRNGIVEVCLVALKKSDQLSDALRLVHLELLDTVCTYAHLNRGKKARAPTGREIVFDGAAIVQNTVHLLIKNGAIARLPEIALKHYTCFEDAGSFRIAKLLLFILANSTAANSVEVCKGIDKKFISATVIYLYKTPVEGSITECGSYDGPHTSVNQTLGTVMVLIAALLCCNTEVASAVAGDARKWAVVSKKIADAYSVFEGDPLFVFWYRGCFESVSLATQWLQSETGSGISAVSRTSTHTNSSKLSRSSNKQKYKRQESSPIGDNNRSPMLRTKGSIVSFEERADSGELDYYSSMDESAKQGSSVKYALALIAAENNPLCIDTDITATSAVLLRLKTGPYSTGSISSRHDLPGAYRSPTNKSSPSRKHKPEPTDIPSTSPEAYVINSEDYFTDPLEGFINADSREDSLGALMSEKAPEDTEMETNADNSVPPGEEASSHQGCEAGDDDNQESASVADENSPEVAVFSQLECDNDEESSCDHNNAVDFSQRGNENDQVDYFKDEDTLSDNVEIPDSNGADDGPSVGGGILIIDDDYTVEALSTDVTVEEGIELSDSVALVDEEDQLAFAQQEQQHNPSIGEVANGKEGGGCCILM